MAREAYHSDDRNGQTVPTATDEKSGAPPLSMVDTSTELILTTHAEPTCDRPDLSLRESQTEQGGEFQRGVVIFGFVVRFRLGTPVSVLNFHILILHLRERDYFMADLCLHEPASWGLGFYLFSLETAGQWAF